MARIRGETAHPHYTTELVEALGGRDLGRKAAAAKLGVSTTLLFNSIKRGEITKSVELAAKAILMEMERTKGEKPAVPQRRAPDVFATPPATGGNDNVMLMVQAPRKALEPIKRVVEWMHGTIVEL